MSTSEPSPGSAVAYARPWVALGVALIGFALTVVVLQTYPAIRPQMPAWPDWAANLLDLLVISVPLVAAVIVGAGVGARVGAGLDAGSRAGVSLDAGSRAGVGLGLARATGIREWRLTDLVLGLGIGLVVRAVVEIFAPTTGTLAGPLAGALPLGTLVVIVLGAVLVSPFVEEWFFRGLVLRALVDALSGAGRMPAATVAIVVSTAAFSALHFVTSGGYVSIAQLIGTVGVGVGCGTLAVLTGRLGGAMAAHATFNAVGVVLLLV
ncbi:CPBP family intramembrane glutamic endopeptidase [Microbacterium sp.]|uniref:CPBP family intramembrane glutamic endopeptidase n=1 Tax=Microbacterium sp. TaxID=51671 RepID=UPI0025F2A1D2|nr:CPBP family intramembrane glutamic endopeptidase [Microbacterium sp.]